MRFGFRELLFILLLLAMPVAAYFLVFQPRNQQIASAREEIRQRQLKLQQLEQATRAAPDLGAEIDLLREKNTEFERKLPAQRETEVLLRQVWELATKHRLNAKNVRPDKPVPAAGYAELPIPITIIGDFDGFYSFLLDLEKLPRIIKINKMQLKKVNSGEGHMQADLVLSVYFEGQDQLDPDGRNRL